MNTDKSKALSLFIKVVLFTLFITLTAVRIWMNIGGEID